MAIKRCPYCRAIIDEKDQYCNNCGTQLLFPDDETIEEEIPGEKIVDEPVEEKDYDIPEPGAKSEAGEPDPADEDDAGEEEEVIVLDEEERPQESIDKAGETENEEIDDRGEKEKLDSAEPREEIAGEPDVREDETGEKPEEENAEEERQKETAEGNEESPRRAYPLTFDTSELDKIGKTAELGKDQVEAFLETLKAREEANKALKAKAREAEAEIPPWANSMKGQREEEPQEEPEDEDTEERTGSRTTDSGIGLPEKVTQAALPFEKAISREDVPGEEKPFAAARSDQSAETATEEEEDIRIRPPFRLSLFLKAKAFDLLFVAVFWLFSLWMAARSMEVTLFKIFGTVPGPLFLYYGILLFFYFFLFYFFLGETFGDRLFRDAGET